MVLLLCLTNNPYLNDGCQFFVRLSGSCLSSLKPVIIFLPATASLSAHAMFLLFVNHCCLGRLRVIHLRILHPLFFISASDDNNSEVVEVVDSSTLEEISFDEQRGGSYLTLEEVAVFLSHLASNGNYLLLA